jgi:hypothetical protein
MKRIPLLLMLLFLPLSAEAQETWTLNPTAVQVITSDFGRLEANRENCERFNLAAGRTDAGQCTQAQMCTATPACPGGASCTAVQALACGVTAEFPQGRRVFPNTTAGREQYVGVFGVVRLLNEVTATHTANPPDGSSFQAYCIWWAAQNQTTKNAECSKSSQPNNCPICP